MERLDAVEIGTADFATWLRDKFDVPKGFTVDLATSIIPVCVVAGGDDDAVAGAPVAFVAGDGTAVPAAGYTAYAGIYNQSSDRIIRINRIRVQGNNILFWLKRRTGKFLDSARSTSRAVITLGDTEAEPASGIFHQGDDITANVASALDAVIGYPTSTPVERESFPNALIMPGQALYVYVTPAVNAIALATFEGEEFDA